MFELIIILSRYFFVFYCVYFLILGIYNIMDEKNVKAKIIVSKQRVCIIYMHLTAFLILSYIPNSYTFDMLTLFVGFSSLFIFIIAYFILDKVYKNSCKLLWNCLFFLFDVGLIMIYRLNPERAIRQLVWFVFAILLILLIPFLNKFINLFKKLNILYLIFALLLISTPFFLAERRFGAIRWISIWGYQFQPSEIVKFLYVFFIASTFRNKFCLRTFAISSASGVFIIVLVLQTALGDSLIFFITYLVLLYIASNQPLFIYIGILLGTIGSFIGYTLFSHVRVRVEIWLNPWLDASGQGYQIIQSLFAIGTWGILGSGLTRGYPLVIPIVDSDFIFSAICEEFGIIFAISLIGVFILLFLSCTNISLKCMDRFSSLIVIGFTTMLAFQTFLILGGVTKLIPLTGITLPFVSYGGSSLIVSIFKIGIIQCVFINNNLDDVN